MEKMLFLLFTTLTAFTFVLCAKDGNKEENLSGETKEVYVDATSGALWQYYSFARNELTGFADDSAESNAVWSARKDWDIAIRRYNIRTNSGEFTTAGAKGGVYTFNETTTFASVLKAPANLIFVEDKEFSSTGMGDVVTVTVRSEAQVILFKKDETGASVMPPVYLKPPVYIFRTADGKDYYKVSFTQYVNEEGVTGHVKFDMAQIFE